LFGFWNKNKLAPKNGECIADYSQPEGGRGLISVALPKSPLCDPWELLILLCYLFALGRAFWLPEGSTDMTGTLKPCSKIRTRTDLVLTVPLPGCLMM
jgi:hypothetical protein